jgi:hypothetical protein
MYQYQQKGVSASSTELGHVEANAVRSKEAMHQGHMAGLCINNRNSAPAPPPWGLL